MEKEEVWRSLKGYDGVYEVSDLGRVKRLLRSVSDGKGRFISKERLLSGSLTNGGYRYVTLSLDGKRKDFKVHQLVAIAFLGHTPCGMEMVVNHIDGDKLNNRADNLEVVTHRENTSSCFRKDKGSHTSIYVGVSWNDELQKWVAHIRAMDASTYLGMFEVELDASNAYQKALLNLDNPEYFKSLKPKLTSKYKNIYFDKNKKKWVAMWTINGKQKHIGYYPTEILAYDAQQSYIKEHNLV